MTTSQESDNQNTSPETTPATEAAQAETADALASSAATEPHASAPEEAAAEQSADPVAEEPATEEAPAEEAAPAAPEPEAQTPAPAPAPAPAPSPAAAAAAPAASTVHPVAVPAFESDVAEAAKFAEVSDEGHVTLLDGEDRVEVGQVPDASKEEALAYFVRKYDDVMTQLLLLEQRLSTDTSTAELQKALKPLEQTVEERHYVGDVTVLREKVEHLETRLKARRELEQAAREQALNEQREARNKIVEQAEQIAGQDPNKIHWKRSSTTMNELFDKWRELQKQGPRLPRAEEDELWKRFRSARNGFDKARRAHFSELDARNAEAKKVKEKLIARAEELQNSTDWGVTAGKYRDLMTEWKAAPRASRKEDDALWARFRAAQDVFFNARQAANDKVEAEFTENLKVKEAILEEGEKLLPFTDVKKARAAMNELRGRWEDAGKVPRKDMSRMERGFRRLEDALQKAEDEHWSRTNPETKARTNSAVTQLEDAIARLEKDLADAQASGNDKKIKEAEEALQARRSWLEAVKASSK